MKYVILSGSHRPEGQSHKVSRYLAGRFAARERAPEIHLISLADNPLPFWDEGMWKKTDRWKEAWSPHSAKLDECDGLVVVAPEWGGMVPSGVKNFFLLCNGTQLAHKPGLIVTVSASRGGSYPVAELRMSSYKNSRLCYIPDHVIVHSVADMLNDEQPASDADARIRQRIDHAIGVFELYAGALGSIRSSDGLLSDEFKFGM